MTGRIFRRFEILVLRGLARHSFGRSGRAASLMTAGSPLREYALFTKACMEGGSIDPGRLYRDAFRLGRIIRTASCIRDEEGLRRLIVFLYSNIGISVRWSDSETIIMDRCYFSRHYTPEQCRIMSNVDSGIIGGILGGGHIEFTERITEGCGRCRACLIR